MAQNSQNVSLGPCQVTLNGVDLGHTQGGVVLHYEIETHDTLVDKYGNTPIEKYLLGEKLYVTVPMAEYVLEKMELAIPLGTVAGQKMQIGSVAGKKMSDYSGQLILHPLEMGSDKDLDVIIYKAVAVSNVEVTFGADSERIMSVEFHGIIDETKSDGNLLGMIGDSAS